MDSLYIFSGLGADKRIFARLDLSGINVKYIEWLKPRPLEALESYVFRLAEYYQIPKQGARVMGLSFGGICISELAKYYDFQKIILISSAKTKDELPRALGFSKFLNLHKLLQKSSLTKVPSRIFSWLFGLKDQTQKDLFFDMLRKSDADFMDWSVNQIMEWKNNQVPVNCLHIHGDKDRLMPIQHVDYSIRIKGAGHFMVYSNAAEISFIIRNFLKTNV